MAHLLYRLLLGLGCTAVVAGCRDNGCDPPQPASPNGAVTIRFAYVAGADGRAFHLDSAYLTASDDVVRVTHLKYYLSRVRLQRADSSYWVAPDAAFLLDVGRRDSVALRDVPPGEYVGVGFQIGLDSATNSRTDHGGDLAPATAMHWSWSTGYKFLSLEGEWLGSAVPGIVEYHIGRAPTLRTVSRRFPTPVAVGPNARPTVLRVPVAPLTVFGGPNVMLLSSPHERNVMFDTPQALRVADNYPHMFGAVRAE